MPPDGARTARADQLAHERARGRVESCRAHRNAQNEWGAVEASTIGAQRTAAGMVSNGGRISTSCARIMFGSLAACRCSRARGRANFINFPAFRAKQRQDESLKTCAFLTALFMRAGFYGWFASPRLHSRQSEQWNFIRTAPQKALKRSSRRSVRWPPGCTKEVGLQTKGCVGSRRYLSQHRALGLRLSHDARGQGQKGKLQGRE